MAEYLDDIKSFCDWLITNPIHSDAQALWYLLRNIQDKTGEKCFTVANSYLVSILGISDTQLIRARNQLIQVGRIRYKKRCGRISGIYEFIDFAHHNVEQSANKVKTNVKQNENKVKTKCNNKNPANPATKTILSYYQAKFKATFNENPSVNYAKDGALIKSLLSTYGEEKLKGLIDVFFESDDPFIKRSGYSVGVFKTVINKLLINNKNTPKQKENDYDFYFGGTNSETS